MYSKAAEEDKNMADHWQKDWQKDADGILIFVSLRGRNFLCNRRATGNRPVYSPLPLPRFSPWRSST